jgi:hypothetical protein
VGIVTDAPIATPSFGFATAAAIDRVLNVTFRYKDREANQWRTSRLASTVSGVKQRSFISPPKSKSNNTIVAGCCQL